MNDSSTKMKNSSRKFRPFHPRRTMIHLFVLLLLLLLLHLLINSDGAAAADGQQRRRTDAAEKLSEFYSNLIVQRFGAGDDYLNYTLLERFIRSLPVSEPEQPPAAMTTKPEKERPPPPPSLTDCLALEPDNVWPNCSSIRSCLETKEMMKLAIGSTNRVDRVDARAMSVLAPTILYQMATGACYEVPDDVHVPNHARNVPIEKSIGYGVLFVTIISLCSLGGAVVLPFMHKAFYKRLLTWMVGLAVGTLAGSGLLHLMPHTFDMTYEKLGNWDFLFKASTIFAGSYLFFCLERLLKTLSERRRRNGQQPVVSVSVINDESANNNVKSSGANGAIVNGTVGAANENSHGHSHHGLEPGSGIAPVAWMIIFGDGLHNFIDGLSIGAAFTESILAGVSISVAVFCEELPHELGDLAILLNSGMKFKQALFYNFLSACLCFLGLCLGIFLGDVTEFGAKWIFALAAGMFLYLSLTDMIPELNRQAEELVEEGVPLWKVLLIQHSGVLFGFSIMLIMAIYGGNINFT